MSGTGSDNGWLEAAVAWEVCASLHRQYCKGKDALFTTRQSDFVKHAVNARGRASHGQVPATAHADSVTEPAGVEEGDIDAVALARYKVVPAHESMFHRFAVVAGDGKRQLYLGREIECANMARKFAGAFLDGAFYQANIAPTPPAQAADSVQEDAARYRWLAASCRSTSEHWGGRWSIVVDGPAPKSHDSEDDFDAAIDAGRKQGANHD